MKYIVDFAGNKFPEALLHEPESPGFDPIGAKRDMAYVALGNIMNEMAKDVPKAGDRVVVVGGRKHRGREGVVFYRGRDAFAGRRYGDDMSRAMADARGSYDRLGIKDDAGEKFFIPLPNAKKI